MKRQRWRLLRTVGMTAALVVGLLTPSAAAAPAGSVTSAVAPAGSVMCMSSKILAVATTTLTADSGSAGPDMGIAADSYSVFRTYRDKDGTYIPLRVGTSSWGYTHIKDKGRWNSSFDASIKNTLRYGTRVSDGGRAYHWWKVVSVNPDCTPKYMRVAVEFGSKTQGVITAYYTSRSG